MIENALLQAAEIVSTPLRESSGEVASPAPGTLQELVQYIHLAAVFLNRDGVISYCNPAFLTLSGYTCDEVIEKDWFALFIADDLRKKTLASYRNFLASDANAARHRNTLLTKSGETRLLEWSNILLRDKSGEAIGTLGLGEDITERVLAVRSSLVGNATHRSIFDGLTAHVALLDTAGDVLEVNSAWAQYGDADAPFCSDITPGQNYLEECANRMDSRADNAKRFTEGVRAVLDGERDSFSMEFELTRNDDPCWFVGRVSRIRTGNERSGAEGAELPEAAAAERIAITLENVTDGKVAEENLRQTNAILEATQEAAAEGIFLVDSRGLVVRFNRRFIELWGIDPAQVDEMRDQQLLLSYVLDSLKDPDEFIERIGYLYDRPTASTRDEIYLKDGRVFDRYSAPAISPNGQYYGRVWSFSDISERKATEVRLVHQAFHDVLTGLPNRALFADRLTRALSRARRQRKLIAVLFLDLDRFKIINDSLGHDAGDQLLAAVANRFRDRLRPEDTASRLGGDEFTILLEDIEDVTQAIHIAQRISEDLRAPFHIAQRQVYTSTSIGISISDGTLHTPEELMRHADAAMYRAKIRGKAQFEVYDDRLEGHALEYLQLENDLGGALERNEFEVYYQPIISLTDNRVMGYEALLRWNHPERGLLGPNEFISLAEESGHIVSIGLWVLETACKQVRLWQGETGFDDLSISVNLSARQFEQTGLTEEVARILDETGLQPDRLMLEITESVAMRDVDSGMKTLNALKELGVSLAIDDFGTGYSSLSYIKKFPLDTIKIDRSFVAGLGSDISDSAIVQAVITLANTLGVAVTAEGIELQQQCDQLVEIGCVSGQGYLFARPQPTEDAAPETVLLQRAQMPD